LYQGLRPCTPADALLAALPSGAGSSVVGSKSFAPSGLAFPPFNSKEKERRLIKKW